MKTSLSRSSLANSARPSGSLTLSVMLFLLRARFSNVSDTSSLPCWPKLTPPGPTNGGLLRPRSLPPGASTRMTSAPRPPSSIDA
ncbi:Uncharacterised protein [Bordetella pertussis]|nr:Uncharacterised protein [Bordetella pertussis]